jgi:hypothetical protein
MIRRNSDARLRELERQAMSTGDPELGLKLLREHLRSGLISLDRGEVAARVRSKLPLIETPQGAFRVAAHAGTISADNRSYQGYPSGTWTSGNGRFRFDLMYGWNGSKLGKLIRESRVWRPGPRGLSAKVAQRVKREVRRHLQAWIKQNQGLAASQTLISMDDDLVRHMEDVDLLVQRLARLELELGAMYLGRNRVAQSSGL